MQKFKGKVLEIKHLNKDVKYCKIEHVEPNSLEFQAGQYFTVIVDKGIYRAYSIATVDTERKFVETYVDITPGGPGSIFFKHIQVGQEVIYMAPGGRFVYEVNSRPDLFISTGTGVVPFLSMINKAKQSSDSAIRLLQGFRYAEDDFTSEILEKIKETSKDFDFNITLSREEVEGYLNGRVTSHLDKYIEELGTEIDVYICGGKEMITDVENILIEKGVAKENIKYEKYF